MLQKFFQKSFLTFILLLSAFPLMSQQQQPKALKFDELAGDVGTSYNETDRIVQERVDRYAAEAARQRGKIKYLVHYRARVRKGSNDWNTSYGWATRAKHAVASLGKVYDDREILVVDGGVRGNETLEFWFVPKGVDLPKPSPEFERSDAIDCPEVIAYQDGHNFDRTSPIVFTARAGEGGADSFDWSFSDGKIIGKNGGSRVEVDVTTAKTDRVTAFLEVRGLPIPCENTAVAVAEFGKTPRLVERFGLLPNGHIRALLDAFLNTLHQHSNFRGYVYI